MEVVIWIVAIILIIAIVWWLLSRNSSGTSAGVTGNDGAVPLDEAASTDAATSVQDVPLSGGGAPSSTAEDLTGAENDWPIAASNPPAAASPVAASTELPADVSTDTWTTDATQQDSAVPSRRAEDDQAEWDTQWSEANGTAPAALPKASETMPTTTPADAEILAAPPLHHTEYTESGPPTLPGAESAAAEVGIGRPASTVDQDSTVGPVSHLVTGQPYGEGSWAPAVDGSGPEGYPVKGNAGSMTYEEETSTTFNDSRADVWFESAAHAEAAGFRAPRRTRS